jgi:phage I-like protein
MPPEVAASRGPHHICWSSPRRGKEEADVVRISGQEVAVDEQGVAVWNARTVHEVADAVRWLAGQIQQAAPPPPPDLSGYATTADVAALQAQIDALEARVAALEALPAP